MRKVYGIYSDNKCKREVNAIFKEINIPASTTASDSHKVPITGLTEGLYLIIGTITITSSVSQRLGINVQDSESSKYGEVIRQSGNYYINKDMGTIINIDYCRLIHILPEDNNLYLYVGGQSSLNINKSTLYAVKLK